MYVVEEIKRKKDEEILATDSIPIRKLYKTEDIEKAIQKFREIDAEGIECSLINRVRISFAKYHKIYEEI